MVIMYTGVAIGSMLGLITESMHQGPFLTSHEKTKNMKNTCNIANVGLDSLNST